MKKSVFLLAVLGVCFAISCDDAEDFHYQNNFEKSYERWLSFKKECKDSYSYTTHIASWTGVEGKTKIVVERGEVVERTYSHTRYEKGKPVVKDSYTWTEIAEQIGTHNEGATPLTLDAIYEKARTDWLVNRGNAKFYFETENAGMISTCGYRGTNCADDCFVGVRIIEILKNNLSLKK